MQAGHGHGMTTQIPGHQPPNLQSYRMLWDIGWRWFHVEAGTPHLCPPEGDRAHCGRPMPRTTRQPTATNVDINARCSACRKGAGLP